MDAGAPTPARDADERAIEALQAMRDITRRLFRDVSACAEASGLTSTDLAILALFRRERVWRLSDMARRTAIPPSTLVGVLDRLEESGLVRRRRRSDDRRVVELHGTPELERRVACVQAAILRRVLPIMEALPSEDLDHLVRILASLRERIAADGAGTPASGDADRKGDPVEG